MGPQPQIITLLTDFGSRDYFVGAMKGVILSQNPAVRVVDLTHEISPQDIHAAAFTLLAAYKDFPAGTIHVAVVDPGVGSDRRAIVIECAGQCFVGPDNGLFSWICEREGNYRARHLTVEKFFRHPTSATFHGRDVFAPVAAALSRGVGPEEFGPVVERLVELESLTPKMTSDGSVEGRIIHIDRFGNCVTNLTREIIGDDLSQARLRINGREIRSFRSYFAEAGANQDALFGIVGSARFLEIVANNSSAAAVLRAQRGDAVTFHR